MELAEHVRRLERTAELREEMLRQNQRQIERKDRSLADRELLLRKMENDLERIDEVDEDDHELLNEDMSVLTLGMNERKRNRP